MKLRLFFIFSFLALVNAKTIFFDYNYKNLTLSFPQFSLENINGFSSIIISKHNNIYQFYLNENSVISRMINKNLEFFYQLSLDIKRMEEIIDENIRNEPIKQLPIPISLAAIPLSTSHQFVAFERHKTQSNPKNNPTQQVFEKDYTLIQKV